MTKAAFYSLLQAGYWTALLGFAALAAWRRPPVITRVIAAILGCGVASLILVKVLIWPSDAYAFAMMLVNGVAAYVVLKPPPSLWQAIIGATYLTQIGLHAAKIISGPSDMSRYYLGLSVMAILQLVIVGGWWLDERLARRRSVRPAGAVTYPAHRKGHDK